MIQMLRLLLLLLITPPVATDMLAQVATPAPGGQTSVIGTAWPLLPEGNPDAIEVLVHSPPDEEFGSVDLILKNTKDHPVSNIEVTAEFRDSNGRLLGVSERSSVRTATLNPGEITIAVALFSRVTDPNAEISFHVSYDEGSTSRTVNLEFIEVEQTDDRVVGELTNPSAESLDKVGLFYGCFDAEGELLAVRWGSLEGKIEPDEVRAFQLMNPEEDTDCPYFLVSGEGS